MDNEETDLKELDDLVQNLSNEPLLQKALQENVDLRLYSKSLENELIQLQSDSVQDYLHETHNLTELHDQIGQCDELLQSMSTMLGGFHQDLGKLSSEIKHLQEQSYSMNIQLRNRQTVEKQLNNFLEEFILPPDIIKSICNDEVNENYLNHLMQLNKYINIYLKPTNNNNKNNNNNNKHKKETPNWILEIAPEVEKLKYKAIAKVREFLMIKINGLHKPKTNIQIIQQSFLIKFSYLNAFLYKYNSDIAVEIKQLYIDTISKLFLTYFKLYITNLSKLQNDQLVNKTDLMGVAESVFSKNPLKKKVNCFSYSNVGSGSSKDKLRSSVLFELDAPSIIPHVADQNNTKFSYESIFRSIQHLLMDTCCSEFIFVAEFFGDFDTIEIMQSIFQKILLICLDNLQHYVDTSFDALGLWLLYAISIQNLFTMKRRQIKILDDYFIKITTIIWNRFTLLFDFHVDSLKKINNPSNYTPIDIHPHYITRRYAEFLSSILSLNVHIENQFQLLLNNMRNQIERILIMFADTLDKKKRTIFLINNYDLILTILDEKGITSDEMGVGALKSTYGLMVKVFVEEELHTFYSPLIMFVQKTDINSEGKLDSVSVERLVKDFAATWKSVMEHIRNDVMNYFSNFKNGSEILKQVLTQLALYYSRLEEIVKKHFKTASFRKDIVAISTLRFEIQKYLSHTFM